MPLTIEQALNEIPVLESAKVLAGEQNLKNVIRWTHIIDHPDVLPWVKEGYLLLTTAFALMLTPKTQIDLIPLLAEKNLAGIIINIGRYMGEIPPAMVSAAKKYNFPLIALPWEINFTDLTHAIHERIINEQYTLSQQVFHIHEVLTQIVIKGGGLNSLADQLAELLQRSITIEDVSLSLLAYKSIEPIDDVRARSISEGRTPPEVVAFHKNQGLYERLRQERRPQRVDPEPELGLKFERVVAPIIVGSQLLGFIWVIATENPLAELDFLAIERAANIAALILSREQAVYEAEQRTKSQIFESLLDPISSEDDNNLSEELQKLRLSSGYQILVVEDWLKQNQSLVNQIITRSIFEEGVKSMIVERSGRSIIVLASETNTNADKLANRILALGDESMCGLGIGISTWANQIEQFRATYEEALRTLKIGHSIIPRSGIWSSERLGFLIRLFDSSEGSRDPNFYQTQIMRLASYDEKHETSLLKTLDVYIDQLLNVQHTTQILFIHRNTLYQRLQKISDLCQIDLNDSLVLVNLYIALRDWNIQKAYQSK